MIRKPRFSRRVVISLGIASFLLFLGGVSYWLLVSSLDMPCETTMISEKDSTDGTLRLYVFDVDCGATTSTAVQVTILPAAAKFNRDNPLFVCDHDTSVTAIWDGPSNIVVRYSNMARIFRHETNRLGVNIRYQPTSELKFYGDYAFSQYNHGAL